MKTRAPHCSQLAQVQHQHFKPIRHFMTCMLILSGAIRLLGQDTIKFSGQVVRDGTNYYYHERGMWFRVLPDSNRMGIAPAVTTPSNIPYNNTPYMFFFQQFNLDEYMAFSLTNGNTFGLRSVALADATSPSQAPLPITFSGIKANGSQVSITFVTPGNGANSFETYLFGPAFATELSRVEIRAPRWAMDNLVVNTGAAGPSSNTVAIEPVQFSGVTNFPTASNPRLVITADFDRDGRPDLVTMSYFRLSFLHGVGNGTFVATTNCPLPGAEAAAAGDLNNDGDLDMVVAADYGGIALLGDGTGNFEGTNFNSSYSYYARGVAVADLNRDGRLDAAISPGGQPSGVTVAFGRGDGSFLAPANHALGAAMSAVVAGDLSGDGFADLVFSPLYSSNNLCVLMNNGDGTFAAPLYYHVGGSNDTHYALALGDFNADANLDVAALNYNGHSVTIWLNNGEWFWTTRDYPLGFAPTGTAAGDLNGDGIVDLIVRGGPTAKALLGCGDGSFTIGLQMSVPDDGGGPSAVAISDFNGDGLSDIALGNITANSVAVMLNESQPVLEIIPIAGYHQIFWPAAFGTFSLEWTSNLHSPGSWQPFPFPPVLIGHQKAVADWADRDKKFYRLRKP